MSLIPDWHLIARKAWSMRLLYLAVLLSGVEVALPLFSDLIPRGVFALASFVVTCGAAWARLVAQPRMRDG